MRFSEDKIKQAILHPEEEIRLMALQYFSDAYSRDRSIMPLVIEAVEQYGREAAFRLLRSSERLLQTEATVDWMIGELRQDFDQADVGQDNYRFALGLTLYGADAALLLPRQADILAAPGFPRELHELLEMKLEAASWDWATMWAALETIGQELASHTVWQWRDIRRLDNCVTSLAHCADAQPDAVLNLLRRRFRGYDKALMQWLDPQIVQLAGEMRLAKAVPMLVERLAEDDDAACDEAITALSKIGGAEVVKLIRREWPDADDELRNAMADVLQQVHSNSCVRTCLALLEDEEDLDVALSLGHALLAQFASEAIEPVRQLVLGEDDELDMEQVDLRQRLVAVATIMEASFPEYEVWRQESLATNWGWGDYESGRLADAFQDELDEDEFWEDAEFEDLEEGELLSGERLDADEPCPCGSGKLYGDCCWDKRFAWMRDAEGNVFRSLPVPAELANLFDQLREAFAAEHGRDPQADDFLFANLPHPEHLEAIMADAMRKAGLPSAMIYAFEQTGLFVTEENQDQLSDADLARWQAAIERYEEQHGEEE